MAAEDELRIVEILGPGTCRTVMLHIGPPGSRPVGLGSDQKIGGYEVVPADPLAIAELNARTSMPSPFALMVKMLLLATDKLGRETK